MRISINYLFTSCQKSGLMSCPFHVKIIKVHSTWSQHQVFPVYHQLVIINYFGLYAATCPAYVAMAMDKLLWGGIHSGLPRTYVKIWLIAQGVSIFDAFHKMTPQFCCDFCCCSCLCYYYDILMNAHDPFAHFVQGCFIGCYNSVNFLTNFHKKHTISRLLRRGMGCILCIQHLIDILPQFLQ